MLNKSVTKSPFVKCTICDKLFPNETISRFLLINILKGNKSNNISTLIGPHILLELADAVERNEAVDLAIFSYCLF